MEIDRGGARGNEQISYMNYIFAGPQIIGSHLLRFDPHLKQKVQIDRRKQRAKKYAEKDPDMKKSNCSLYEKCEKCAVTECEQCAIKCAPRAL
jgi:hypothetical protein